MVQDSKRFMRGLVESSADISAHEMVDRLQNALSDIHAGHGNTLWHEGQPASDVGYTPRVRWHLTDVGAHVYVDVRGLGPDDVRIEARKDGMNLKFDIHRERVQPGGRVISSFRAVERFISFGVDMLPEQVAADVRSGVLHIYCPRSPDNLHRIPIKWEQED